jgi:glutamate 5-kinase
VILLSDIDGLYKRPPAPGEVGEVVHTFLGDSYKIEGKSTGGRGGMQAKIDSVMRILSHQHGPEAIIIANGFNPDTIQRIIRGEVVGTIFRKQHRVPFLVPSHTSNKVNNSW